MCHSLGAQHLPARCAGQLPTHLLLAPPNAVVASVRCWSADAGWLQSSMPPGPCCCTDKGDQDCCLLDLLLLLLAAPGSMGCFWAQAAAAVVAQSAAAAAATAAPAANRGRPASRGPSSTVRHGSFVLKQSAGVARMHGAITPATFSSQLLMFMPGAYWGAFEANTAPNERRNAFL